MIPILYDTKETAFISNGLGRLRDCISCVCSEERNGVYECSFEYPVDGANFNLIKVGRIIGVTHDESGDIQPFDIVSYTKPIDGIVTFYCTHISYRQSYLTVTGSNINSLEAAFLMLKNAQPNNPFSYQTDKTSTGYMGAADGLPKTVRSMLGGTEGSILDTYGGEYEWDRFNVKLHSARGVNRDFSIRYGVNMLDYNEELDSSGTYMACVPYWTDGTLKVVGDVQTADGTTITNRGECVPLDVSDKFESKPTKAQVNQMGKSVMNSKSPMIPSQNIHVEFIRLQDMPEYEGFSNLLRCNLCDTINVVFPGYNSSGRFKIVKTVWDVLADRYESMELGDLSITLAEALGINTNKSTVGGDTAITTIVNKTLSSGVGAKTYVSAGDIAMEEQNGYKAVGIVGWSTTNWHIRPTTNYIKDNTTLYAGFANDTTDAVSSSVTIGFRVLWVKGASSSTTTSSGGGMSVLDFYPVGSYYETSDTTFDPNTAWGGTWVLETAGQVHVSAGNATTGTTFTVNGANASSGVGMSDGGEEKHWLTVDEMPTHNHGYYYTGSGTGTKSLAWWSQSGNGLSYDIVNTGGNQTHNTMQPYIVVNRWHRTA